MSDYYDSSASDDYVPEFDPWTVATTGQGAAVEIANRIKEIERLYKETIALAHEFDIDVDISLHSEYNRGHNHGDNIRWNSSSQHC